MKKKQELEYQLRKLGTPTFTDEYWKTVQEDFDFFCELFKSVGFVGYLKAIDNRYWPIAYEESQHPWYEHHSSFGTITIGWRKRVISIHWDPKKSVIWNPNYTETFGITIQTDDQTTHDYSGDNAIIHAWTTDKAKEYLQKLYNSMSAYHEKSI